MYSVADNQPSWIPPIEEMINNLYGIYIQIFRYIIYHVMLNIRLINGCNFTLCSLIRQFHLMPSVHSFLFPFYIISIQTNPKKKKKRIIIRSYHVFHYHIGKAT